MPSLSINADLNRSRWARVAPSNAKLWLEGKKSMNERAKKGILNNVLENKIELSQEVLALILPQPSKLLKELRVSRVAQYGPLPTLDRPSLVDLTCSLSAVG